MEPEKFEDSIKRLFGEREIKPSAAGWEKLEQRFQKKEKEQPYLAWMASAAAVAAVFFVLGTYFNAPVAPEGPQVVEQESARPVLEEKKVEPEMIQLIASEEKESVREEKKPSTEKFVRNVISEIPLKNPSKEEIAVAEEDPSEETESIIAQEQDQFATVEVPVEETKIAGEVSDHEVEALLLLATAELHADTTYTVNANDLLHQVEYELDQSFRQKVFEVVKDGLKKARTAVANRDF